MHTSQKNVKMNLIIKWVFPAILLAGAQNCNTIQPATTGTETNTGTENLPGNTQVQTDNNYPYPGYINVAPTGEASNIAALEQYSGNSTALKVTEPQQGGNFILLNNASLSNDGGMIFPSKIKGTGWHWVRQAKNTDPINLKWYGAKGLGLPSYKDDSAALVNSIKFIKNKGGGALYIPASTSFYGFNGNGILLPDNIEIYGDGPKSEIKHVNPESGTFYRGVIFFTTTYGPNSTLSIAREPVYTIQDAQKNQSYVVVDNPADLQKLKNNAVIGLAANFFFKKDNAKKPRFSEFELNEIVKLNADTVFLKHPLSVALQVQTEVERGGKGGGGKRVGGTKGNKVLTPTQKDLARKGGSAVIIDASGDHSYNDKLGVYDRLSKNISIHDMTLSQAEYNMISNTQYNADGLPGNVIALGGTLDSRFYNLTLNAFGNFGGNMYNRCDVHDIKIVSSRKLIDFGYGSANTKIHDIEWVFKNSVIDTVARSFAYINDGTHDIEIYNLKASGNWSGTNLIQIAGGAHHIYIHDINLNIPAYNSPDNTAISLRDDNNLVYVHYITFKNINITLGIIKEFVSIRGDSTVSPNKNILFDNVHFTGTAAKENKHSVYIKNCPYITFNNVSFSSGNIYLENVGGGTIQNLVAPQADITITNNAGRPAPKIINSKYKSITNL